MDIIEAILGLFVVGLGALLVLAFGVTAYEATTAQPQENLGTVEDFSIATGFNGDRCTIETTKTKVVSTNSQLCGDLKPGKTLWKSQHDTYLLR